MLLGLAQTPLGGGAGCRRDDEETLHPQARPVLGLHLLLHPNPRTCSGGGRDATILSSLSAFRASDGLDAGGPRVHRAHARAGTLHPFGDPIRGTTRPDLVDRPRTGKREGLLCTFLDAYSLAAGSILHGLLNVSRFEFRISCDHFGGSLPVGQKPENQVDRDAQAANTGPAIALPGVHSNTIKGYGRHSH